MPKIDIPVLLIQGEQDPIVSSATAKYLKDNIPQAELHLLPGIGHAPQLEDPKQFNQILKDFIINCEKQ